MQRSQAAHKLEVTTPSDREVVMTRAFDAPSALVFDAFTKPDLIQRWLLGPDGWSMPVCEVDLREGGRYRYTWRNDENGTEFGVSGTYREIAPPQRIVHTERFESEMDNGEALVHMTFAEANATTTVTMTLLYESQQARDASIESGMEGGVAISYDRLAAMLEKDAA